MSSFKPWKIHDIDASLPPVPIECPPGYQGVLIYFWWKDSVVAHSFVARERLPLTPEETHLETVESLKRIVATLAMTQRPSQGSFTGCSLNPLVVLDNFATFGQQVRPTTVSVIVCTRDRPGQLQNCLDSLVRLDPSPTEIIVVDNASTTDETKQVAISHDAVRYIREDRPGLDIARNTGFSAATSELVAFVDDDVVIEQSWLRGLIEGFRDADVSAVTGLVLAAELETEAQWTFERHWPFNRGYLPKTFDNAYYEATKPYGTPSWEIGAGANMAFRREVFEKVGPFDERLDVGAAGCSGDSEYWHRILAAGMTIRYEPRAVVRHFHRRDESGLRNQLFHYMRGHTAALLIQHERGGGLGNLKRLFVSLPAYYCRLWLRRIRRGTSDRLVFLGTEIAGGLSGIRYYLKHRRPRRAHTRTAHTERT